MRNPQGEGSKIRQRPDGRYTASIRIGDGRRKSVYGRTYNEARSKLARVRDQRRQHVPVPSERLKLSTYLDEWLAGKASEIRPGTYAPYESHIRLHLTPQLGSIVLVRLEPGHVRRLYAGLVAGGMSPTTVRRVHAVLRQALQQAMRDGLVSRNVAALVRPPRAAAFTPVGLSPEQARAFLAAVAGDHLEALYWLLLTTGLREGELLALKWSDVNLDGTQLAVRRTLRTRGGEQFLEEPKTASSKREVMLTGHMVDLLRRHRAAQRVQRLRVADLWQDQDLVFCDGVGRPLSPYRLLRTEFRGHLRRLGLPAAMRLHDLRHAFATMLIADGVPVSTVSSILGHSRISTTLNVYVHPSTGQQQRAIDALDRLLPGAGGGQDGCTSSGETVQHG